jgi:hypothetical protein
MPDLPIERGRPGPGLVADVVVGKYLDGLPLYRQSAILARDGIEIERATLADWVGHAAWWVTPLAELIGIHVMAAPIIHTDDTPIAVLAPGNGKTRTGRLWAYVVDERPWRGERTPAAYYRFSADRRGERPRDHLAGFRGVIQADAFSGYQALTRPRPSQPGRAPPLTHAACWAHARRKLYDVFEATKSPIAEEALKRIGELYQIEAAITGQPPETRLAARQDRAVTILDALRDWLTVQRRRLSAKTTLARAIQYALSRWEALTRYAADGRLAIDNNVAERALRGIAMRRSLCPPCSSLRKHWNLVYRREVTRATCSRNRGEDVLGLQVNGPDLIRRPRHDLLGGKDAVFDQPPDAVMRSPEARRGLGHCEPFAVLLGRAVGVNAVHPAHRADAVRGPGFALTGRHSHPVQRCGDVRIRPAGRHAAHHRERLVGRAAAVLAGSRLADAQL